MEALLPFALILVVGWLLLIRPQRRRQQQMADLQSSLRPGVQVMLAGGLHATVVAMEDETVLVEAAPGVQLRYAKQAVMQQLTPQTPADPIEGADEDLDAPLDDDFPELLEPDDPRRTASIDVSSDHDGVAEDDDEDDDDAIEADDDALDELDELAARDQDTNGDRGDAAGHIQDDEGSGSDDGGRRNPRG